MKYCYEICDPCMYCKKVDEKGRSSCPIRIRFYDELSKIRTDTGIYVHGMITNCDARDPKGNN